MTSTDLPAIIARVLAPDYERYDNDLQCHEDAVRLADECSRLQERVRVLEEALVNISAYLPPGSGSVALQVCDDMRADARAALEGIEVE